RRPAPPRRARADRRRRSRRPHRRSPCRRRRTRRGRIPVPWPYDARMADDGPLGNPFEGLPFFGDLAKALGQQGGASWDSAKQLAVTVATDGQSEANVDPVERMSLEQLARVAE